MTAAICGPPWSAGATLLHDYGHGGDGAAIPILLVPSLINRAYILDLSARRSFARWLSANGFRLFVDRRAPGAVERGFTLADYVTGGRQRRWRRCCR